MTIWDEILTILRKDVPAEDFRRSFSETAYASDSGDQITVWVPTEAMRRHLTGRYGDAIHMALTQIDRRGTHVRFVVTGVEEEEEI
jgi:chromosomal replication initiation ATPase DnaA